MEGLDLGQMSNPSLAWKMDVFKINDDDDDDYAGMNYYENHFINKVLF